MVLRHRTKDAVHKTGYTVANDTGHKTVLHWTLDTIHWVQVTEQ